MRSHFKQQNTHLIVLAAVAAFMAFLLFLDAFVPVIPDGKERPDREEENAEDTEEIKKHWWENIFNRDEPDDTMRDDRPVETEGDGEPVPIPTLTPVLVNYYTNEEMFDQYYDALYKAISALTDMEAAGEIEPIEAIGLYNYDLFSTPELIVKVLRTSSRKEYRVFDLMLNQLHSWEEDKDSTPLLYVYATPGQEDAFVSLLTIHGDGDDELIWQITSSDRGELLARIVDGSTVTYRSEGKRVSEGVYTAAWDSFDANHVKLDDTALRMQEWRDDDPKLMVELLLTSGQRFVKNYGTGK